MTNSLIVDLIKNDRQIRFLLSILIVLALTFALPGWALLGISTYAAALGYRS